MTLAFAEIAGRRITSAAERDRANVTFFARQRFRAHHDRNRIKAFHWLASRNAVIGGDEGERNKVSYFGHGTHPV
jgi:hypothetical protein